MSLSLHRLKKSWLVIALCLGLACKANADLQSIIFDHGESKIGHLLVVRGAEVNLKNDHRDAVYNISLIHTKTGKSLVNVQEISAGGSVRMEFTKEGLYRLYYSLQKDDLQSGDRYVLIDVVAAHPA